MYDENNIFAKILRNEIPCKKIYEDKHSLFFYDINPQAKIHVLGIPKVKVIDFHEFIEKTDTNTTTAFFKAANFVIDKLDIKNSGFRIVSNSGTNGGQEVPHFHIHILAGEKIGNLR